jgi:tetratricopeptide (TPR) repeat protein
MPSSLSRGYGEISGLETRLQTQNLLAHVQHIAERTDDAIATLEQCLAEAERAQLTVVLRVVLPNLVTLCAATRQVERGRAFHERGIEALRFVDDLATQGTLQSRLGELCLAGGDLGAALRAAHASIAHYEINRGGSPDFAPWCMAALIHWFAGDHEGAAQVYRQLPDSSAWLPVPASHAIAALKIEAAALPHGADRAAQALAALRVPPDAAYSQAEVDYWLAYALQAGGRHDEAAAVAAAIVPGELGLLMHRASLQALRLRIEVARGRVDAALIESTRAALADAPPLESLELGYALAYACRALGDAGGAQVARAGVAKTLDRLAGSLEPEAPALAAGLRRRWHIAA